MSAICSMCDVQDSSAMMFACWYGHLDCLKAAHRRGFSSYEVSAAILYRSLECLKYIHENNLIIHTRIYCNADDEINSPFEDERIPWVVEIFQ